MRTSQPLSNSSDIPPFRLNKQEILAEIHKRGKYTAEGIEIRKWENVEDTDSFVSDINNQKVTYKGILNGRFEREGYGLNINKKNSELYFGYFEENARSKHGIFFLPISDTKSEWYIGFWRDNKKDNKGIYVWIDEPENNQDFNKANFDAYIGEFQMDNFKKGTYLSKDNDDYYLYHGNIDMDGTKNDNNAFFYSAKRDTILNGKIVNNVFVKGYVGVFNNDPGDLIDIMFVEFNPDGTVKLIKKKEELVESEKEPCIKEMTDFRNVILQDDYFGQVYNSYKYSLKFIEKQMGSIDIYDDKQRYPEIIKLCVGYNNINIYNNIEKLVIHQWK